MNPPQPGRGHLTPSEIGLVVLHSGYRVHARKLPKRPRLTVIGAPHVSQISSVVSGGTFSHVPSRFLTTSIVVRHSGYPWQAPNEPLRPHLITIGLPHFSHVQSVGSSSRLTSRISARAFSSSSLNGP